MSSRSYSFHPYAVIPQACMPVTGGCEPAILRALRKRSYTLTPELPESAMSSLSFLPCPRAAIQPACTRPRTSVSGGRHG